MTQGAIMAKKKNTTNYALLKIAKNLETLELEYLNLTVEHQIKLHTWEKKFTSLKESVLELSAQDLNHQLTDEETIALYMKQVCPNIVWQ
ncbi:MAG: hypothetical protein LBM00_07845 [Deltaproteobacteria bacterium]|jgi:hypothetical protein|nr:hypothetical protein [Deltaproteobacteria bacterium]